jgi:hypothetical protein
MASLSRSAADACGVAADNAATIAAMPTIKFTLLTCFIVAPVLLTKRSTFALAVVTRSVCHAIGERMGR